MPCYGAWTTERAREVCHESTTVMHFEPTASHQKDMMPICAVICDINFNQSFMVVSTPTDNQSIK